MHPVEIDHLYVDLQKIAMFGADEASQNVIYPVVARKPLFMICLKGLQIKLLRPYNIALNNMQKIYSYVKSKSKYMKPIVDNYFFVCAHHTWTFKNTHIVVFDILHLLYLYIIRWLLLKYHLIFLQVLKVFDEPLGESNTERRIKISGGILKEGTT